MEFDFDLCGGIYPKVNPEGARHNGLLCEPDGRAASCPARALCIFDGLYGTEYTDIDLLAIISGYSGKPFDWLEFLAQLQTPREKA